ncbi:putative bifunctional diguanylate cyclase/phosphodiesterase [Aureimonas mangrovi]|uniref:putative bifunctional diguanylate cyclase/phosphodiesterase n=1 Tax=Aureimonas mangrovi TaxID=2758041 RepID=UPI00163D7AF5|nr:bifunctional diguanylate cyclase/phosphodiesterase [Aureimonas mangrovi]
MIENTSHWFRVTVLCQATVLLLSLMLWVLPPEARPISSATTAAILAVATIASLALLVWSRDRMVAGIALNALAHDARFADLQRDALTGALARRFFVDELKQAMRLNQRLPSEKARPVALLLIDLDHFKKLNDSYGHNVGDYALTHLVSTVETIFPGATVGRLGGDEFAVLVRDDSARRCVERAEMLLTSLRHPAQAFERQIHLSVSIGIARSPEHSVFAEDLILLADLALYESKRNGRARVTIFDDALLKEERHRRFIERELRAAILLDHLDVHYQPLVDANGTCVGVEALARWRHPSLGMIPPGDFIPVAEASTLIDLLGKWVFRRICRDFESLPGEYVSFNVSAAQLRRNELVEMLREAIVEHGLDASSFVIEITENLAVGASVEVMERLKTLRAMGFRVALDDFGTGHCSFSALRELPVDVIKVDRSYISSLAVDPVANVFVSAIAQTGRLLDLPILAEGIETEEEWVLARAAGCKLFQGYHFAKPKPLAELADVAA